MSLYLVQASRTTAALPDGGTVTVPDLGAGRYHPVLPSERVDGAEPRRLHVYLEGQTDPLCVEGAFEWGSPVRAWYAVHATRGDAAELLSTHGPVLAVEKLRQSAAARDALKTTLRPVRNSSGNPVALLPAWASAGKSPRALATGGEDPDEMEEIPELEVEG